MQPDVAGIREMLDLIADMEGDPTRDLALEEDLLARGPGADAALLIFSWPSPVLVLGCGQRPETVDLGFCQQRGIPVVRRSSGGTGVVHQNDLAVSLVLPPSHPWARSIPGLYDRFLRVIQSALQSVGVETQRYEGPVARGRPPSPICFEASGPETLLVSGRKAVGCAQARRRRAVLVHGALLLNLDPVLHGGVFGVSPERILASLCPLPSLDRSLLCRELSGGFSRELNLPIVAPNPFPNEEPTCPNGRTTRSW